MVDIYCTKCDKKGYSKCPYCRSVFSCGENMMLDRLEDWIGYQKRNPELPAYNVVGLIANGEESAEDTFRAFLENVVNLNLTEKDIQQLTCCHHWAIVPGQTSSIGCGHAGEPISE